MKTGVLATLLLLLTLAAGALMRTHGLYRTLLATETLLETLSEEVQR